LKHRILVVEDNQANRELLCDWLEAGDFEVVAAENLEEAFAAFKNQPPHAVLLDVQLGPEDGLSLATWIRREPKLHNIPVIAVTAHAMITDQERVLQAGCNACVSKPVDFKLLGEQLEQWLTHVASLQYRP
ncbi:MAG: response regulator, partial [Candidatus Acidiferrales bacterium]